MLFAQTNKKIPNTNLQLLAKLIKYRLDIAIINAIKFAVNFSIILICHLCLLKTFDKTLTKSLPVSCNQQGNIA